MRKAAAVALALATVWFVTLGPRMAHRLTQCGSARDDGQVVACMRDHGWTFDAGLGSCDKGSARDPGCYDMGYPGEKTLNSI